jgi:hypothetical protein
MPAARWTNFEYRKFSAFWQGLKLFQTGPDRPYQVQAGGLDLFRKNKDATLWAASFGV